MGPRPPRALLRVGLALTGAGLAIWVGRGLGLGAGGRSTGSLEIAEAPPKLEELFEERPAEGVATEEGAWPVVSLGPLEAEVFFPILQRSPERHAYDPHTYFAARPSQEVWVPFALHPKGGWIDERNALGLRDRRELAPRAADLRVLVTGDSHTQGACALEETFTALLEDHLAAALRERDVEVVNAGQGSYSFPQYLGTWERFGSLEPDVFCVVVYGGNDFAEAMPYWRYARGEAAPVRPGREVTDLRLEHPELVGTIYQDVYQARYFTRNPDDLELAGELFRAFCAELAARTEAGGATPLLAYLPPASAVQPKLFGTPYARAMRALDLSIEDMGVSERLAEELLAAAGRAGIRTVDLRPALAAQEARAYWPGDLHIDVRGHAAVAEALAGPLAELLGPPPPR